MAVDPVRAALVTEPFSRRAADDPAAPGVEATVVAALADAAGADAFLARVAPLAKAGLGRWQATLLDGAIAVDIGARLRLNGAELGAADGGLFIVTGLEDDPNTDSVTLTLRGPEPA